VIRESLAGKRLLVTGSTGFLGTALVERLLRSVPECELVVLIRPGKRSTVARRLEREVLKNNAFDRLRTELGADGFAAMCAARIQPVAGDVSSEGLGLDGDGRALFASCDVLIHSAATVSFDSPLDRAVEVNLLGARRIVQTAGDLGVAPHLVAVSTCYVAGSRRGHAPEEHVADSDFFLDVDWRGEVEAARRARADAEADSRDPERLRELRRRAHQELGAAGTPLLAEKTENLRAKWVADRLVEAGRARAQSLGWPDVYAYTKALGERALLESRGDVPVSIVRPSIIESAYEEPYPGWIRGFRMAEPVLISYARGLLREFPGVPEGIVDVIPVDHVVGAIVATAASEPPASPTVVQVASGSVNPLRYRRLVDTVRDWFTAHPLFDSRDQPIAVPDFEYGGRGGVVEELRRAKRLLERTERVLAGLPLRGKQAEWNAAVEEKRDEAERALGYVELYGAYAECEAVYGVDRLLERFDALDEADREAFWFDPRVIDWHHYITNVHLPSVVEHARVKTAPSGRSSTTREDRLRGQVLSPDRHLAAFDLENTLIASNVVASYSWLATRRLPTDERLRFAVKTLMEGPALLKLDRRDRSDFLRHFYRRYDGAPADQIAEDSWEMFSDLILTKSFPAAIRRVREHRRLGHRTVLITGALDFVIEPLRPLFDDIVCARLRLDAGRYTGELVDVPPTGETRAEALADYAQQEGLSLDQSVAYADSTSDLPMLEAVGFPVAVNPETRLAAVARKRGWLVEHWDKASGGPRPVVPMGDRFADGARHRSTVATWADRARRRLAEAIGTEASVR
jgi:HAD superfamily hydrolase (TIGR01490 family)